MGGLAALFPGQGSQHVGMGADLAEAFPSARSLFERANELLGLDLARLCWEGPEDELKQTENAQPAILVHSYAVWTVLQDDLAGRIQRAAGHSLGEFTAYAAAGSLTFEEAVRLVRRRGELMAASPTGTMAAVVGLEPQVVEEICARASSAGGVVVAANYNSPQQVVISGSVDAVEHAGKLAKQAGAKMVRGLAVSGAFHSPLMGEAEAGLREELERIDFRDPQFPVVANATAETVVDAASARSTLLKQLTAPVRWTQSMQRIAEDGVSGFLELGPGKVLTGLLRRIDTNLKGVEVGKAEDVERFKQGVK